MTDDVIQLSAVTSALPATNLVLDDESYWYDSTNCGHHDVEKLQDNIYAGLDFTILPMPSHLPIMLIEYWFRCICPMRSTFDSGINYNRQVAWSTWSVSKAVNYSLQMMSAACLLNSMPQLRAIVPSLKAQATAAITWRISQIGRSSLSRVTADLVFAVISLGTSLHWIDPRLPEPLFLESARELLGTWQITLIEADVLFHAYSSQALTYWEMLLAATGHGSIPAKVAVKRQQSRVKFRQILHSSDPSYAGTLNDPSLQLQRPHILGTRPNSWCGVSNEVIAIFGEVLALCRSACLREASGRDSAASSAIETLCDISMAQELQQELIAMDFAFLILIEEAQGYIVLTQDDRTPVSHLLETAEAYRQAGLLQLYLTFSDLPATSQMGQDVFFSLDRLSFSGSTHNTGSPMARADFILARTLELANILERIPPDSGSRSIHPMLYLSVAAGLRFDSTYLSEPSQSYLDISHARMLVCTRLGALQQMLPHQGSGDVLQLVEAIWQEYDAPESDHLDVHWLHVMSKVGLANLL